MSIELTKVIIQVDGKELAFTPEQARGLKLVLDKMFPDPSRTYPPYTYPPWHDGPWTSGPWTTSTWGATAYLTTGDPMVIK